MLVISTDTFTGSRIPTVVVVVVTSNLRLARAPGNVRVSPPESGLARESVVNCSQVLTIDKIVLTSRIGHLTRERLGDVEGGLRGVLGL